MPSFLPAKKKMAGRIILIVIFVYRTENSEMTKNWKLVLYEGGCGLCLIPNIGITG